MATRQEQLNAAYQAKLAARRNGTTEVKTYAPNAGPGLIAQISDVDARYQAKIVARIAATRNDQPEKVETEAKPVAKTKGDSGKG